MLFRSVERLLLLAESEVDAEAVRSALPQTSTTAKSPSSGAAELTPEGPLAERVLAFERSTLLAELEKHARNVTHTAKALGLERSHFYKKCQQLGIDLRNLPGDGSN